MGDGSGDRLGDLKIDRVVVGVGDTGGILATGKALDHVAIGETSETSGVDRAGDVHRHGLALDGAVDHPRQIRQVTGRWLVGAQGESHRRCARGQSASRRAGEALGWQVQRRRCRFVSPGVPATALGPGIAVEIDRRDRADVEAGVLSTDVRRVQVDIAGKRSRVAVAIDTVGDPERGYTGGRHVTG